MSEMSSALKMLTTHKLSTAIEHCNCPGYPAHGKYTIVGSIPIELTEPKPTMYNPSLRKAKYYNTEQEVIDALLSSGITKFQLSNCKFYSKP